MTTVVRGTVDVGSRTVAFRRAGHGPAAVLVGSPAHTSAADVALIVALAATHTVLAIDPPGLGFSDPLPPGVDDVPAIAAALADTLTALGVDTAAVIGRHLGGAVAVELTLRAPHRFPLLVLDDVPLLDAGTRASWRREHTTIPARDDGSHLLQLWYRRRRAFVHAPWFDPTTTLDLDLTSPDVLTTAIHAAVLDQLDAGDAHAHGERTALAHDTVAALRACTVEVVAPTPSHPSLGSLGAVRPGIAVPVCPADLAGRRDAVVAAVAAWTAGGPPPLTPPPPARGRWTVQLPATPWGQLAVRRFRPVEERREHPLVLLHASPLSGESLLPLARELAEHREVIVLDTLGNGDSDKPDAHRHPQWRHPEIADFARVALAAVQALGVEHYDVFGTHTGALIALEMGIAAPDPIGALVLDGLPLLDRDDAADATPPDYFVDLTPRWDGAHLVTAWSNVVDVLTWFPWNQRDPGHRRPLTPPPTAALHRRVVQMLKGGTSYPVPHGAVLRHATTARLLELRVPTAFCRAPADPMAGYAERARALVPGGEVLDLAAEHAADAGRICDWLDRRTARAER